MDNKYEAVIGLEVHAQLLTESKAFSREATNYGDFPNTNTTPISLGHPGTLPVVNENLIKFAIKMGLATNCKIRQISTFSRKNYFYNDLPKGYQISQYEDPICYDGYISIEKEEGMKRIGITRIHMEEDTGKSIHDIDIDTLLDYNRAGVPLIEIVSEPDISSSSEAYQYLIQLKQILMYLGICTGNMEEGALRCDANVSVRLIGEKKLGTKTEVKNLNSFRNVEKAIEYEIARQIAHIENGGKVTQETMMWDGGKNITRVMRSKENAHDYRYFPEPDLPPIIVPDNWITEIKLSLTELPLDRKMRFISQYSLPSYDADIFVQDKDFADFFESCCAELSHKSERNFKLISNWLMTEVLRILTDNNKTIINLDLNPKFIAELVELFANDTISSKIAKQIFPDVISGKSPKIIIEERGLLQVSDTSLIAVAVDKILSENPDSIIKYKSGKTNVVGFLIGQIMKETKGKANPKIVNELLIEKLEL